MFNIMQVIIAGLKTEAHKEFKACSTIFFGCVIPRVKLNEKVSGKLLKTVSKMQPKNCETLSMLALLFRCQIHTLNMDKILEEFLNHENILLEEVFMNVSKKVDEDQDFARKLLKCLALMCEKVVRENNDLPTPAIVSLLKIVQQCLNECLPTSETAEIFINCISRALLHYKTLKKKTKGTPNEAMMKGAISACTKILDVLRTSFVEEYSKKSAIRPENDVVYVEGYEEPSEEVINANRILMQNEFVRDFTEKLFVRSKLNTESIDVNYKPILKVLQAPDEFLLKQLGVENTVNLLVNALKHYQQKPKVIKLGLTMMKRMSSNSTLKKYLEQTSLQFELLVLPCLFGTLDHQVESINEILEICCTDDVKDDSLMMMLKPTIKVAMDEKLKPSKLTERIIDKLSSSLTESKLACFSKTLLKSDAHDDPLVFTVLIKVLSNVVKANPKSNLYFELITLILSATKKYKIKDKPGKSFHQYVGISKEKRVVCSQLFEETIETLIDAGKDQKLLLSMLAAIWQIRSVNQTLIEKLLTGMKNIAGFTEFSAAVLAMPISEIFHLFGEDKSEEASILKQMHLQATDYLIGKKVLTSMYLDCMSLSQLFLFSNSFLQTCFKAKLMW